MNPASAPIGKDDLLGFVDDRLQPERQAAVEAWLRDHPDAAARVAADRAHCDALRSRFAAKAAEPIPARLRTAAAGARSRHPAWRHLGQMAAGIALLAVGGASGFFARGAWIAAPAPATTRVTQDAVAAFRTYTVEVVHPVEVAAKEQTHLLQWLSKRLGRPLPAPDLSRFGYRLVGGRLLPAGDAAAAMLMYETESGSRLTVYVRAGQGGETAFRYRSEGDLSTFAWLDRGFGFAVSASLVREKLQPIVDAVYRDFDTK